MEEYQGETVRVPSTFPAQSPKRLVPESLADPFDRLLLESVDQALADLLGVRARDLIYDHLATHYTFSREGIPQNIDDFYSFLEKTFGSASRVVGKTIMRRLYERLGWQFPAKGWFEFIDCLDSARRRAYKELNAIEVRNSLETTTEEREVFATLEGKRGPTIRPRQR